MAQRLRWRHCLRPPQGSSRDPRWTLASKPTSEGLGRSVANVLNLDIATVPEKVIKANRAKISTLLKAWTKNGALVVVEGLDDKSEKRPFIEVGDPAND